MTGPLSNIIWIPCGNVQLALHDFGGYGDTLIIAHANGFPALCYEPLVRLPNFERGSDCLARSHSVKRGDS